MNRIQDFLQFNTLSILLNWNCLEDFKLQNASPEIYDAAISKNI